jgi:outer membrane protein
MSRLLPRVSLSVLAFALVSALVLRAQNSAPSAAQPAAPAAAGTLTLEDCIARALKKNFDVQIQSYTRANARDSLEIAKAQFDPNLSLTASRSFSQSARTSTSLNGASNPTSDSGRATLGVNQEIATGANVGLSTQMSRSASNSSFNTFNPSFNGNVGLTVSQPLLKGGGRSVVKAAVERSQIGILRADLDFKAKVLDVVQSTENAYYNYLYAIEQLRVRQQSLDLANKVYEENQTRKSVGVGTDLDILTAQVGVANAQRQIILAQQQVKNSADALLAVIGQFELDQPIGATKFEDYTGSVPTVEGVYAHALANQPDYLSTKASLDQTKIDLRVAKNARNPDLSVNGSLGYSGLDNSASNAYQDVSKGNSYNWSLGVSLNVPWWFRGSTASYRQALANLGQQQTRLRQLEQNMLVQARAAVVSVQTNLDSVKISTLATELSAKQYDLSKARFDAGLITARVLQQARDDLDTARVNELQSRINLRQAVISLSRLEGSALDRYSIKLAP